MIAFNEFIEGFEEQIMSFENQTPWDITNNIKEFILSKIANASENYRIENNIAIHTSVLIEEGAVIKGPAWISEGCFVGTSAYMRDGVFLGKNVSIGPGCEIKSSILMNGTRIAHFNFIGNSILGNDVNFEAGALIANHYNERSDKSIRVSYNSEFIETKVQKFGALIGDHSRIGANAVLSPGTMLPKNSIVKRLELVEQNPV